MAGVNSVIRVIAAPIVVFIIIVVSWIGVKLYEPISQQLGTPAPSLGWPTVNIMFFMALGLIGLVMTVVIWLVVAPIKRDVRQETRPPY